MKKTGWMDCRISGEKEKSPEEMTGSRKLRAEVRLLRAQEKTGRNRDIFLKKIRRDREEEAEPDTPGTYLSGNQEKNTKNITIQSCYYVK